MAKTIALFLAAAALALGAGIYTQRLTSAAPATGNQPMPDIVLRDLQDTPRSLREWQGKVVLVNFWATWCPPCREEMPEFVQLQDEFGERGFQIVGIAIEDKEPVQAFARKLGINYPILIGETEGIGLSVQMGNVIGALPYSVVVDRNGKSVHTHPGKLDRQQVLKIIEPLL